MSKAPSRALIVAMLMWSAIPPPCAQERPQLVPPIRVMAVPRRSLAQQILARAEASNPDDPTTHALLLYRSAGAWLALDFERAPVEYRQAFLFARQSSVTVRAPLEEAILNELLPLSPLDAGDLIPSAEPGSRDRLFQSLVKYWLFEGDYRKAMAALDSALDNGILPGDAPIHLMATIPTSAIQDRVRVFREVVDYCQQHPDDYRFLAQWIARFYAQMPRTLVQEAIRTDLEQAAEQDKAHPVSQIGEGEVSFGSVYNLTLFKVAHAFEEIDPDEAHRVIAEHREVSDSLKRYPMGFDSAFASEAALDYEITPNHFEPDLHLWGEPAPLNLDLQDLGLEFYDLRMGPFSGVGLDGSFPSYDQHGPEVAVIGQLGSCPPDLPQHLEEMARAVPMTREVPLICTEHGCSYEDGYPRAELFESVAVGCLMGQAWVDSRSAVTSLDRILNQIPEKDRVDFLARTADLYLRLGDRDEAWAIVQQGFELAEKTFENEKKSEFLQNIPPGFWSSSEIYRRMVTLGVQASLDQTQKAIDAIPDANLRAIEQVMITRALLGVPVRRLITVRSNGRVSANPGFTYAEIFR